MVRRLYSEYHNNWGIKKGCRHTSLINKLSKYIEIKNSVVGRKFLIVGCVSKSTLSLSEELELTFSGTSYNYILVDKGAGNYVSVKPSIEHCLNVFFKGELVMTEMVL